MPGCMNGDCIDTSNACFCHEGKVIDTKYYKYTSTVSAYTDFGLCKGKWGNSKLVESKVQSH